MVRPLPGPYPFVMNRRAVFLASSIFASLLWLATSQVRAQVTVTEPPDLANSVASPTPIVLGTGLNRVSGSLGTPSDGQDNFTVTVPAGSMLTTVALTLDTSGGFMGSVTFNLSEVLSSSGNFTTGLPLGPGTYYVQVITDFSVGNTWSMRFGVPSAAPVCGNGVPEGSEACDDGNTVACDGCSSTCTVVIDGCDIGGTCVAEGTSSPGNVCKACRPTVSRTVYSPIAVGTECDDGRYCTESDACNAAGDCSGTTRGCGDGLTCTADVCDEDGDACTNDVTTGCFIEGACVAEGAADPSDACSRCEGAVSRDDYTPLLGCLEDGGALLDGGSGGADAGGPSTSDGGPRDAGARDAAATDGGGRIDAGAATPPAAGGCGCRSTSSTSPGAGLVALVAVGLFLRRRR